MTKSVDVLNWQFKLMVSILFIGIVLWGIIFFMPRTSNSVVQKANEVQKRIHGKESAVCNGREYQIIEIDGVEYISTQSGICPLLKK